MSNDQRMVYAGQMVYDERMLFFLLDKKYVSIFYRKKSFAKTFLLYRRGNIIKKTFYTQNDFCEMCFICLFIEKWFPSLAHRKDSSTQLSSTNWQLLSLSDYKSIFVTLRSTRWIYGRRPTQSNWSNLSQCAAFGTYLFSLIAIYSEGCARESHFSN